MLALRLALFLLFFFAAESSGDGWETPLLYNKEIYVPCKKYDEFGVPLCSNFSLIASLPENYLPSVSFRVKALGEKREDIPELTTLLLTRNVTLLEVDVAKYKTSVIIIRFLCRFMIFDAECDYTLRTKF